MKILQIITKGEIGGAQKVVLNSTKQLKKENNEIIVGCGSGEYLKNELNELKISCINFKNLKRTINPLKNLFFIFELKKFLNKNNIDIIYFHSSNSLTGGLGAKLSKNKPKTIFTFHGLSVLDPNYKTNPIIKFLFWIYFKFFLYFIDEKIFVCQYNLKTAQKIKLVKNGKIVYNAIDKERLNFFTREEARQKFEEKCKINLTNKFIIGSVGRLAYPKNYEFLISVFPDILKNKQNAVCIIIGEGPEREKYSILINKLNLTNYIFLIGEIMNAHNYLKAFDLFVLPSKYEGLSISILEAQAANIPILASKVGGNEEILKKEELYQLDNSEIFLKKIKNYLN